MSTVHANSAADALRRLESMILSAGESVPAALAQRLVDSAVDFVVHLGRADDGSRRVVEVLAVPRKAS